MKCLQLIIKFFYSILCSLCLFACNDIQTDNRIQKTELLELETEAIRREFENDTTFLSNLMDSTFIELTKSGVKGKHEVLSTIYNNNILNRENRAKIDSFKLIEPIVHLYGDAAVVTFIMHTYGKMNDSLIEKRTRFYDVWVKRSGKWKAVTWQASAID